MKPFKQLSFHDNKTLLNLPVYIALLAANGDGKLDNEEKLAAIEFATIKTFAFDPLLETFYKELYGVFEKNIMQIDKNLPKEKIGRELAIKNQLVKIEKLVLKLDEQFVKVMYKNMNSLTTHISRAHHNMLIDFIFPIPISGIN